MSSERYTPITYDAQASDSRNRFTSLARRRCRAAPHRNARAALEAMS
ncbi:hypothetical protein [Dyella psychrodurans]|nr:hypothetical protein [Dyella psychrodurans]